MKLGRRNLAIKLINPVKEQRMEENSLSFLNSVTHHPLLFPLMRPGWHTRCAGLHSEKILDSVCTVLGNRTRRKLVYNYPMGQHRIGRLIAVRVSKPSRNIGRGVTVGYQQIRDFANNVSVLKRTSAMVV